MLVSEIFQSVLSSFWKSLSGDKEERCERKEVMGSGLLEYAAEWAEVSIWPDFCV
jgi:hypothetical protein